MKFFNFKPVVGSYAQLRFQEESDEVSDLFGCGRPLCEKSFKALEWKEVESETFHDCPIMGYGIFAFSDRAWAALRSLVVEDAEAISLTNLSKRYFAINVLSVLPALDEGNSQVTLFRNGKVDRILKHVFKPEVIRGHHMFRIPQRHCDTFVSELFLDKAIGAGLKGLVKNGAVFECEDYA